MGCGCGGKPKPTPDNPAVFGEPVGDVLEVIASVNLLGLKPGERTWVRGSHVPTMISSGWIRPASG